MSRQWDALVIGAGPAGLRAASVIAESGLEVVLVDEQAFPGGQIYRHVTAPGAEERFAEAADYRDGTELVRRFRRSGAEYLPETTVWFLEQDRILASRGEEVLDLRARNVIIAAIRKIVPDKIRIAMFIVVIAGFVTCVDLLIQAFVPALSESLGVFIPLIVVNCIILGRAESFSYKNGVAASFWDGIFQGFGYTVVLMVMCIIREFLGAGTFGGGILNGGDGIQILPEQFPIGMLTLPVGGFLVLGCLIALMQWALSRPKKNKEESK